MIKAIKNLRLTDVVIWLLGAIYVVLALIPLYWMAISSLKPESQIISKIPVWIPETITFDHYIKVFERPILLWFKNTIITTLVIILFRVFIASLAGYAFARLRFKGRDMLFTLMLITLMIPPEVTLIPLYLLVKDLNLVNTLSGIIVPNLPSVFAVYLFRQFFLSLPKELEDAAMIDGCTPWTTFLKIALPLAKPAIIVVIILSFVDSWNALTWPLVVSNRETQTLAVGLARFNPQMGVATLPSYIGPGMAASTLMATPVLLVYFLLQRYIVQGISTTGLK